jgi:2-succinyl-5-enolpyruvyl-6-hydroxy-3-cyclohexene-1-carboxylate synthase
MERTNRNYAFTTALVRSLAEQGLQHVAITPGSRNSPLALAFADHPEITDWVHLDERSAAFFALGAAKTTGRPAAVVTTSGTAAVELHPAAVEARLARIPLLLLTADRPPELRDVGAPQAINQTNLFGSASKWFHDAGLPQPGSQPYAVRLAAQMWAAALDLPPGPVHVNFPFREPLAPVTVPGDADAMSPATAIPSFHSGRPVADQKTVALVAEELSGRKGLIVAGPLDQPGFPSAVAAFAARAGFPIIADPLSQLRTGPHDRDRVVVTGDALARAGQLDDDLRPEAVVRFGAVPTSKALSIWLAESRDIPQILVDHSEWRDPGSSSIRVVRTDPVSFAAELSGAVGRAPEGWTEAWTETDRAAYQALIAGLSFPSEPAVVTALAEAIPAGTALYVGSSMPIRDVDTFFPSLAKPVRILSNRGANGIDGLISSGLGASVAGQPVVILGGDLSLLHDLTALGTALRYDLPATIVVVNNDGGGIFHFLPQAAHPQHFERLLGTPHGTNFQALAAAFGVEHHEVSHGETFQDLLVSPTHGPRLIEVHTDRRENVAVHEAAWQAVAELGRAV